MLRVAVGLVRVLVVQDFARAVQVLRDHSAAAVRHDTAAAVALCADGLRMRSRVLRLVLLWVSSLRFVRTFGLRHVRFLWS